MFITYLVHDFFEFMVVHELALVHELSEFNKPCSWTKSSWLMNLLESLICCSRIFMNRSSTRWWTFMNVKESFNCKIRMPGTVKCMPTVAYWVQIDGINKPTELITRYYLNERLIQCCFHARPTSATLVQHWTNIEWMYDVWEKVLLPSKHKTFV